MFPRNETCARNSLLAAEGLGRGAVGAVADHHERCRDAPLDAVEDLDDVEDALDGPEVRDVHEDLAARRDEPARELRRLGREALRVDEVRDDDDLLLRLEDVHRDLPQVLGDRRHGVGACSIPKRVIGRYERSCPTIVTSVPWSVVTRPRRSGASISRARCAEIACGRA